MDEMNEKTLYMIQFCATRVESLENLVNVGSVKVDTIVIHFFSKKLMKTEYILMFK